MLHKHALLCHWCLVFCDSFYGYTASSCSIIRRRWIEKNFERCCRGPSRYYSDICLDKLINIIMGHDAQNPEYWSQNRRSLLDNDSVNTFPRQRIRKQQSSYFRYYATRAVNTSSQQNRGCIFCMVSAKWLWRRVSWVSRRQPAKIWAWEQGN
jgi:hypothetical protein